MGQFSQPYMFLLYILKIEASCIAGTQSYSEKSANV